MKDLSSRAQRLIELTSQVDGPGPARRAKVRAGLAATLGAGTASAAAEAALAGVSAGGGKIGGAALGGLKLSGTAILGWLGAGAALGVVVSVSGHLALGPSPATREVARAEAPQAPVISAVMVPREPPSAGKNPLAAPPPVHTAVVSRMENPRPIALERPMLAEETRLLDETQVALRSGNSELALALVEQYERRFSDGSLREEARAARVLALCRAGRREEGRSAAAAFSREFPGSPLVPRVRRSCEP